LLAPCAPRKVLAVGLNYRSHIGARTVPTSPEIFYKPVTCLQDPEGPIVIPRDATNVQYEGELVAVIGRKCTHLTRDNALTAVMGWTIGNDVSERTWQKSDRTMWRSKNTDTFKPMGPWIETDVDLESLVTKIRLNGKQLIEFHTNHMVFGVVDYLVAMTRYLTLYPGDMVWMGTEGATQNMQHGDTIEVEINQIGTLRNPVVREA